MRIYYDKRQTLDLYGKFHKGLEMRETQFYPSKEQKANGFGDDILMVGNSFGLGALRGWADGKPQMLDNVKWRTQRVIASGPLRAIVEVEDRQWRVTPEAKPVNMTLRYTLYAGHRDCDVDVMFSRNVDDLSFSTGIVNVKGSTEYSDKEGLRGCWGTDWPAGDTINYKRETVGLGIYIPKQFIKQELAADKENYAYVIGTQSASQTIGNSNNRLHYSIVYCSDNEEFGFHSAKDWFNFLKDWKKRQEQKVVVTIK